jgi:hypothetical protein
MMICHDDNANGCPTPSPSPLQDNDISTEAAENKRLLKQWLLNNSQWHIFNQGRETDHQILRTDIRG